MKSFDEFMIAVDTEITAICGLTHRDLSDYAFSDVYEDGWEPEEVAHDVLNENGFPFTDE